MTDLDLAYSLLKNGKLVAIPTETVYGLAADASQLSAIHQIFIAKGRPSTHPLIVHLPDLAHLWDWGKQLSSSVIRDIELLAQHFWPGPLTVIIKKADWVPDIITGQQDTVAIRVPNHPLTLALLHKIPTGLVAPSANRFGRISPTTPEHVKKELGQRVDYILDGGPCCIGLESTIINLNEGSPIILRPGMISFEHISAVLNKPVLTHQTSTIRAPGVLTSHYAPQTPFYRIMTSNILTRSFVEQIIALFSNYKKIALIGQIELPIELFNPIQDAKITYYALSDSPDAFSQKIYSTLHILDESDYDLIICLLDKDLISSDIRWLSVLDRLKKATLDDILL